MKVKVCGMKYSDNIQSVAALNPDYLGFIFYAKSSRFVDNHLSVDQLDKLPQSINKVGVFVNATAAYILEQVNLYGLDLVQLHGDETPTFCEEISRKLKDKRQKTEDERQKTEDIGHKTEDKRHKTKDIKQKPEDIRQKLNANCQNFKLSTLNFKLIKAFQLDEAFDFDQLSAYKPYVDYFLFDTKSKGYGGTGKQFDWELLKHYDNETPFFLSGGIGLNDAEIITSSKELQKLNIHAVDINSCFETKPAIKDSSAIKKFITTIKK